MPATALDLSRLPAPWGRRDATDLESQEAATEFADRRLARAGVRHYAKDARAVKDALAAIDHLPAADEVIHLIVSGRFPLAAVIPAVLALADPATVDELQISTLSFSRFNAADLIKWIDAGLVRGAGLVMVCAEVFAARNPGVYDAAAADLRARGGRVSMARTHAKILNIRMTDGRVVTAEASANLRSAKSVENITLSGHPDVYAFHREWISAVRDGDKDRS